MTESLEGFPQQRLVIRDDSGEPVFAETPVADPMNIADLNANAIAEIFNRAQRGEISWIEAKRQSDGIGETQAAIGEDPYFMEQSTKPEESNE